MFTADQLSLLESIFEHERQPDPASMNDILEKVNAMHDPVTQSRPYNLTQIRRWFYKRRSMIRSVTEESSSSVPTTLDDPSSHANNHPTTDKDAQEDAVDAEIKTDVMADGVGEKMDDMEDDDGADEDGFEEDAEDADDVHEEEEEEEEDHDDHDDQDDQEEEEIEVTQLVFPSHHEDDASSS